MDFCRITFQLHGDGLTACSFNLQAIRAIPHGRGQFVASSQRSDYDAVNVMRGLRCRNATQSISTLHLYSPFFFLLRSVATSSSHHSARENYSWLDGHTSAGFASLKHTVFFNAISQFCLRRVCKKLLKEASVNLDLQPGLKICLSTCREHLQCADLSLEDCWKRATGVKLNWNYLKTNLKLQPQRRGLARAKVGTEMEWGVKMRLDRKDGRIAIESICGLTAVMATRDLS